MNTLQQLNSLLQQFDNEQYNRQLRVLSNSTIGQHTRHIIEFYQCLYDGIENGWIEYDKRKRDVSIEQNIAAAQDMIRRFSDYFTDYFTDVRLQLVSENKPISTTLARELHYLNEHTVHHLAIIRIGIQEELNQINIESDLGVASSTIQFRKKNISEA